MNRTRSLWRPRLRGSEAHSRASLPATLGRRWALCRILLCPRGPCPLAPWTPQVRFWQVSRGVDESGGPDLCADGTDAHVDPAPAGTSFATARVSRLAAWTFAMIRWLGEAFRAEASESIRIHRSSVAVLDTGWQDDSVAKRLEEQRTESLRKLGFEHDVAAIDISASRSERWCAEVRAELTAVGLEFEGEASPSYVKRLLLLAAQLVSDGDQSRGGRRVVSEDLLRKFYGSFTPSIFYRFCGTSDSLTERQADLLHRLDLELGSFWDEPAMFVAWNFCHLIDLHNLKVVAGYGRKDP